MKLSTNLCQPVILVGTEDTDFYECGTLYFDEVADVYFVVCVDATGYGHVIGFRLEYISSILKDVSGCTAITLTEVICLT